MIEWGHCETRGELLSLIRGRRIYIFVMIDNKEKWVNITRKALLFAMANSRYEFTYKLVDKFQRYDDKSILLEL